MGTTDETSTSPAAEALAKAAGWREALRERFEALSFRRLVGKGPGARRKPPVARRKL